MEVTCTTCKGTTEVMDTSVDPAIDTIWVCNIPTEDNPAALCGGRNVIEAVAVAVDEEEVEVEVEGEIEGG